MTAALLKSAAESAALLDQAATVVAAPTPAPSALLDDIGAAASEASQRMLDTLFGAADEVLYVLGERAADAAERRLYLDCMRLLHLERGALTRRYQQQLLAQFRPLAAPTELPEDEDSSHAEQIDEQVALINLGSRIKHLHAVALADLQQRFAKAASNGLALPMQALSPRRICHGFALSLRQLEIPRASRMVLYRLFDRLATPVLGEVYDAALEVLTRYGIGAAPAPSAPCTGDAALRPISKASRECLQRRAAASDEAGAAETLLATELLALVNGKIAAGGPAVLQRLSLASAMIEQALVAATDPSDVEALHYAALRCAVSDSRFLADAAHPLRRALQERTLPSAADLARFAVDARAVLAGLRLMEPVAPTTIEALAQRLAS